MTDLLWLLFIFIAFVTGFLFGVQRERRHWTRTVTHLDSSATTLHLDSASGLENGDIIVAYDSRTGKPRRRS